MVDGARIQGSGAPDPTLIPKVKAAAALRIIRAGVLLVLVKEDPCITIVILGGGTAGALVANRLRRKYPATQIAITVVDADDEHHYQPGYLFLPFGIYSPDQIVRSRHSFLPDGVELVLAAVEQVDAAAHAVHLADGRTLDYDTLVIATGVQPHRRRPRAATGRRQV